MMFPNTMVLQRDRIGESFVARNTLVIAMDTLMHSPSLYVVGGKVAESTFLPNQPQPRKLNV